MGLISANILITSETKILMFEKHKDIFFYDGAVTKV